MSDVNWKEVAETIKAAKPWPPYAYHSALDAAIRLCELASRLPPGEAERVLEKATECGHLSTFTTCDGARLCMTCKRHA